MNRPPLLNRSYTIKTSPNLYASSWWCLPSALIWMHPYLIWRQAPVESVQATGKVRIFYYRRRSQVEFIPVTRTSTPTVHILLIRTGKNRTTAHPSPRKIVRDLDKNNVRDYSLRQNLGNPARDFRLAISWTYSALVLFLNARRSLFPQMR